MSELDEEQIPIILDLLVGETCPAGDTYIDDERMQNVKAFEKVCDWVYQRIEEAQKYRDCPEHSRKALSEKVIESADVLALASNIEWGRESESAMSTYGYVKDVDE